MIAFDVDAAQITFPTGHVDYTKVHDQVVAIDPVNGLVPGLFPHQDMTADIQGNLDRTNDKDVCQPALRVGERQELGWAATFLASPYANYITGETLVVDGANWQRRSLMQPEFTPIREQLGKGDFEP